MLRRTRNTLGVAQTKILNHVDSSFAFPQAMNALSRELRSAIAAGFRDLQADDAVRVAIVTGAPVAVPPCGACRQVLAEFGAALQVVLPAVGDDPPSVRPLSDYAPPPELSAFSYDDWSAVLQASVDEAAGTRLEDRGTNYATLE